MKPQTTAYPLKDFEVTNWDKEKHADEDITVKTNQSKVDEASTTVVGLLLGGVLILVCIVVVTRKNKKEKE